MFNKVERSRLRQALYTAIESHEALIDAHYCEWAKDHRNGQPYYIVPHEHRPFVDGCRRDVAAWKRLIEKLLDMA